MEVQPFDGKNGMEAWTIKHASGATATVYAHGATVTSVTTAEGKELLFVSEASKFDGASPIRGGIPLVFPIFGAGWGGIEGLPSHGFARRSQWQLHQEGGSVFLTLASEDIAAEFKAAFPHEFKLKNTIDLDKDGFSTELAVTNSGDKPFSFQALLHTYYSIPLDISAVTVDGLGGVKYVDKLDEATGDKTGEPSFPIKAETDQIFKSVAAPVGFTVAGDGGKPERRVQVTIDTSSGKKDCVVWNPWVAKAERMGDFGDEEWHNMLCVEPGNVAEPYELAPGATFTIRQTAKASL